MTHHFCTLFDKNYLYKGLALYNSLERNCLDFRLFILCMDDITYELLNKLSLSNATLISLKEFEDSDLLQIKPTRTVEEYCWTCTASLLSYILKKWNNLEKITYLDADLFFYSDPQPIFDEFGQDSVFITEHNFPRGKKELIVFGKYNVQFVIFRNNKDGRECLYWWREKTIESCFRGFRNGQFVGDQIYLNDFPEKFRNVHILKNNKFCLAPWNADKYNISLNNGRIYIEDTRLIFYHFHTLKVEGQNKFDLVSLHRIKKSTLNIIYSPYVEELKNAIKAVSIIDPSFRGFIRKTFKQRMSKFIPKIFFSIYIKLKKWRKK